MSAIKSRECRFVFYVPKKYGVKDTHIVKEILHHEDGSVTKELRIITDFKRPLWVTKEHHRNHKQKKESAELDTVIESFSTEANLARSAAVKLGSRYVGVKDLRTVRQNPYLYGIDVNSRTYIKHLYQKKYNDIITPYEVCVFDIEVDTLTNEITIISIATKDKIYTVMTKKYLQQKITTSNDIKEIEKDVIPKLEYLYSKYIPKTDLSKNIIRNYSVAEDELHAIRLVMNMAHKWKPDFMSVWNIDYDLNKLTDAIRKYNVDPKDIFCDPDIPEHLKYFKYKEGVKQKVTASGKSTPVNPEEQWHTVDCPASFYWIDAMSAHRYIRVGGKSVPGGYSLNNILGHELGKSLGKLSFEDEATKHIKGIDWHQYMSAERPLEYVTYNQWDVMSVIELDTKTKDLQQVLPMLSGISNFDIFNSGPKRIIDALHFFYLDNNRVLSCKNSIVEDKDLLGLGSWIILLPSCRISDKGAVVLEGTDIVSNVRKFVYDIDQVSGYPSNTQAANVSIDTTAKEIKSIEGMKTDDFRTHNINLLFGKVNSLSYGSGMFKLPTLFEILDEIK